MPLGLYLYKVMTFLIAPFLGAFFCRRARAGKEDGTRLNERFARNLQPRPAGDLIWFHAASVGESQLLLEMARRLIARGIKTPTFLFTCQTQTAASLVQSALRAEPAFAGQTALQQMAAIDTHGATRRFLDHWKPNIAIFAEGEVWPNTLLSLQDKDIPTVLLNARMTEKSTLGWMRWPKTSARVFGTYDLIIAADLQTKTGLEALSGKPVSCPGNLKSALPAPNVDESKLETMWSQIGTRPILLAASTHAGEEALIIDSLSRLEPEPFLIIAPRHPERGDEVDALLSCTKLAISRRSADDPVTETTDVLLADTMGEMGLWYRLADAVYLGGGHAPGVGGHNPLEALRLGKPVLSGPSVFNFSDLSKRLLQHEGFTLVEDAQDLIATYPPAPVSKDMMDMLDSDAIGPISVTLEQLDPILEKAGLVA
ncbi:MAG: glycosyltransferase N-terminal domain-containing protein [Pseudomonadota bacterium]